MRLPEDRQEEFLRTIIHAELRAHTTYEEIRRLCLEARYYRFGAVLVHPIHCKRSADALRGSNVRLIAVVAFPTGAFTANGKAFEARDALACGADEIAFVIDIGGLLSERRQVVAQELGALREAASGHPLTASLEASVLTDEQIGLACDLAADAQIEYIAPFTGFESGSEARMDAVRRLVTAADERIGVIAWGRVGTVDEARNLLAAGAVRLCTGVGVRLALQLREGTE